MDRMNDDGIETKLDALFAEYRGAVPDQDGGVNFMPDLWQKIEARRDGERLGVPPLGAGLRPGDSRADSAMAILIPRIQTEPVYTATYVDALDAAHSVDSAQLMDSGDSQ